MNPMRSTLSDFLDDNLPYNYRPWRVKIALTYTIVSPLFIREITFFISNLSNSYILHDGRVITPWLRCAFMCLESIFRSEKLETLRLNSPISGFLHLWEAAQTWRSDNIFSRSHHSTTRIKNRLSSIVSSDAFYEIIHNCY